MKLTHRNTSGLLPTANFDLVDDAGAVIGFAQLRHKPSCSADLPAEASNHVYYEIHAAHRGRGYGKALLALVLDEARRIGLGHVRLPVDDSNQVSRHIIESAGGVLVGEYRRRGGELCRLYEVTL